MTRRTDQQRKSIEVACRLMADAFNDAGFDKVKVLEKKAISVSWNQDSVKEDLFKEVMKAICYKEDGTPKESTTELNTDEVSEVWMQLNRWTGQEFGLTVPFPTNEENTK